MFSRCTPQRPSRNTFLCRKPAKKPLITSSRGAVDEQFAARESRIEHVDISFVQERERLTANIPLSRRVLSQTLWSAQIVAPTSGQSSGTSHTVPVKILLGNLVVTVEYATGDVD